MKLKKYAAELSKLAKLHPNAELIMASDDEGNSYRKVYQLPELVSYSEENEGILHPDDMKEMEEDGGLPGDIEQVVLL